MNPNDPCADFRQRLARALDGLASPAELRPIHWHEHLLGCTECRTLLEQEEALEALLATLPAPQLPADLARRVLARLTSARAGRELDALLDLDRAIPPAGLADRVRTGARAEVALDRLLELDPLPVPPEGLAARVAAGARRREGEALESLLELDGAEAPPEGLSGRVLRGVAPHRRPALRRLRLVHALPRYAAAAAAVLLVLGATWWIGGGEPRPMPEPSPEEVALTGEEPDPELLAALEVLVDDSLWVESAEEDLELLLAEELDPEVEVLLAYLPAEPEDSDR